MRLSIDTHPLSLDHCLPVVLSGILDPLTRGCVMDLLLNICFKFGYYLRLYITPSISIIYSQCLYLFINNCDILNLSFQFAYLSCGS